MNRFLALVALSGCWHIGHPDTGNDQVEVFDHEPQPGPIAPPTVRCGPAPELPGISYSVETTADPSDEYARVPVRQWLDHVAWTEAIQQWSACMTTAGHK